jgi:hypothetical protein
MAEIQQVSLTGRRHGDERGALGATRTKSFEPNVPSRISLLLFVEEVALAGLAQNWVTTVFHRQRHDAGRADRC